MWKKRLEPVDVGLHSIGKIGKVKGQQIRIRQAHHRRSGNLGERASVSEVGVVEVGVPIEVVVNGMVNPAAVLPAKSKVQDRDAEEILEGCVIGASPGDSDAKVFALAQLLAVFGIGRVTE